MANPAPTAREAPKARTAARGLLRIRRKTPNGLLRKLPTTALAFFTSRLSARNAGANIGRSMPRTLLNKRAILPGGFSLKNFSFVLFGGSRASSILRRWLVKAGFNLIPSHTNAAEMPSIAADIAKTVAPTRGGTKCAIKYFSC